MRELRRLPEQADFPAYKKSIFDLYTTLIDSREELLHLPDGTTLRAVTTPHAHGGLLFFYEDVSDRLELERARNTLVAVQRATIDHLSQGIAVFGSDGRLNLFNPVFAQIWQLDPSYLDTRPHVSDVVDRGRALLDVDEDWQARRARIIAHTLEREPRFARVERPDGLVLDYASAPLPDGGMLFTYLDVTDSTHVERALRDRTEALEAADKLKSEFIANVWHQLRTPLNTIIGFSEILRDAYFGPLTDRQREYNTGVLESSQHLLTLINDILDLAMIEAGRMVLETHPFEIQPMLTSVLGLARERSLRRKVTLEFDCPRDIGRLDADERRIKQVLFNLVSNALRFTPAGGTVALGARRDGAEVAPVGRRHRRRHRRRRAVSGVRQVPQGQGAAVVATRARGSGCRSSRASSNCTAAASISSPSRAEARA